MPLPSPPSPDAGQNERPLRRWPVSLGLGSRVLLLVGAFVMLAEVAIYVPSIANFRNTWLRDRLAAAHTAALVFEAAPKGMIADDLANEILESVGAKTIAIKTGDTRRLLAASDAPPDVDESYDLRNASPWQAIAAAFRAMTAPQGRVLSVVGGAPMGGEYIEITIDEGPLKRAMNAYSVNILLLSLIISALVAGLAMLAIHLMVLRPVRRLTSSLLDFGADPEDAGRIIQPSGARHEIGRAEEALRRMQLALSREFQQKKHLAALGLAVAKINHDLRNMLASAQLVSDRLTTLPDPLARRLAPKLVATLDRAISFCTATLAYGRAVEPAPSLRVIQLDLVAQDVSETVSPEAGQVAIRMNVPKGFMIVADADQLFRVLLNLARNAAEALASAGAPGGEPPRIEISARQAEGAVIVEVSDNGPGVAEALRPNLFAAFHGTTRPGGSGLGLAIAADLVRAHGGRIELVAIETGALFRITLPDRPATGLRAADRNRA